MLALAGVLGFAAPALLPATDARAAQAVDAATAPIQKLDQGLLTVMRQGRSVPFAQRVQTLTPAIEAALDLPQILRAAVGPGWSGLSATQQQRLLAAFRQYTVATFVENFDSYDGQTIAISPSTRALSGGAQVVSTTITSADGKTKHTIDYVMRKSPSGAWKATDVLADGTISRVAVLRSDFSAMLSEGGAQALEASLHQKTRKLENG